MANQVQTSQAKILIHAAAVAAGAASGALAQGSIIALDTPILSTIYVALVRELGSLFDRKVTAEDGIAILAVFEGYAFGVLGVKALLGLFPLLGNAANASISFATTEAIGWYCFNYFDEKTNQIEKQSG